MKTKLKKILVPFCLMLILDLGIYYITHGQNFGGGLSPHIGILLISGLLFGVYGVIGSVVGNMLCDLIRGYDPLITLLSALISFAISYLGYKLWYNNYKERLEITRPKLNNTSNVLLFLVIINICGILYALLHGKVFYLTYPNMSTMTFTIEVRYFLNFINSSFIFGLIGISLSNKIDFVHIPQSSSKRKFNEKLCNILGSLLIASIFITLIIDYVFILDKNIILLELIIVTIILLVYLIKPQLINVSNKNTKSIPGGIMNIFLLTTLIILFIGFLMTYDSTLIAYIDNYLPLDKNEITITMMTLMDVLLLIYFIPSIFVLRYIEQKVINPFVSFSKIEEYIHENEKIESEDLINIYTKYIAEETEIGTLARSYVDLIKFNNQYIENIRKIEGEKKRIETELEIATKIQATNLPTKAIKTNDYIVNGYSKPAKEVGGDFFDYYQLDEDNLAIMIGDASGKGIPAAIFVMITQVMIKQIFTYNTDPSKILYLLNNQLCENNSENMFITLWLGIYNKTTKKLIFSNAGHNPPLLKEENKFKYMNIDTGIVLGIMEDFEFEKEEIQLNDEIVMYTDGITDANNLDNEMYGENRLKDFFDNFNKNDDLIDELLTDINNFTKNQEQFDDMTLLYLKVKK